VMSYVDRVDFGITVDPELVPDPWHIADGIPPALDELSRAVDASGQREAGKARRSMPKTPAAKEKKASSRKTTSSSARGARTK
ncbi:MAG: WS/DGAT domain-containing protein, partial [Myxococcota bacterium]